MESRNKRLERKGRWFLRNMRSVLEDMDRNLDATQRACLRGAIEDVGWMVDDFRDVDFPAWFTPLEKEKTMTAITHSKKIEAEKRHLESVNFIQKIDYISRELERGIDTKQLDKLEEMSPLIGTRDERKFLSFINEWSAECLEKYNIRRKAESEIGKLNLQEKDDE